MGRWIEWMQHVLSEYYVHSRALYAEAKEVELLKDFFATRIESLKERLETLTNEKEDFSAEQEMAAKVKEHLVARMQMLDKANLEKSMQLLLLKQQVTELGEEKKTLGEAFGRLDAESRRTKSTLAKEVKALRRKGTFLAEQNREYKGAIEDFREFFSRIAADISE